jgi:hypothetical protein
VSAARYLTLYLGSASGAALAANATISFSQSADLTTGIALGGSANTAVTQSSALTTGIALGASATFAVTAAANFAAGDDAHSYYGRGEVTVEQVQFWHALEDKRRSQARATVNDTQDLADLRMIAQAFLNREAA